MTEMMYCPKCGKADQKPESYCRDCGRFLNDPDGSSLSNKQTPQEQFNVSLGFNLLSAIFSVVMAIALIVVHAGEASIHGVIYAAIVTFFVIATWQTGAFFNNLKLKNRFKGVDEAVLSEESSGNELRDAEPTNRLPEADLTDFVPASVTERTTRDLTGAKRSTKTEE